MLSACGINHQESSTSLLSDKFEKFENTLVPKFILGDSTGVTFTIENRMAFHHVPGVSIAIGDNSDVVYEKGFGSKDSKAHGLVDAHTMFQAASLSKAVTAVGVLILVEKYNLSLDQDINQYLADWKLDHGAWSEDTVSIARLLRHRGGIKDRGFQGHTRADTIPNVLDLLNGKGSMDRIVVKGPPGVMSYSGSGYLILQYLIEQVSGMSYSEYMQQEVFSPLKMKHSTYDQLPTNNVSHSHDNKGLPHEEGWLLYPELAAAGLWTTAGDLTRLCQGIVNAYQGKSNALLSKSMVDRMLESGKGWGLGVGLRGDGDKAFFFHGGSNPGTFTALMICPFESGQSIAVMSNAKGGESLNDEIVGAFGNFYNTNPSKTQYYTPVIVSQTDKDLLSGKYQFREEGAYYLEVEFEKEKMIFSDLQDGMRETYVALDNRKYVNIENGSIVRFVSASDNDNKLVMHWGENYKFYKVK